MKQINFYLLDLWNRMMSEGADYVPVMHLYGFLATGQRVLILDSNLRPHCIARPNEKWKHKSKKFDRTTRRMQRWLKTVEIHPIQKNYFGHSQDFFKLVGTNPSVDIKNYEKILEKKDWEVHESDIYYDQVYMKARGIRPCAWNKIVGDIEVGSEHYPDLDGVLTLKKIDSITYDFISDAPNLRQGVFDIEGERPILTIFYRLGKHTFPLKNKGKDDRGEKNLLIEFGKAVNKTLPDLIYTYNGNRYDWIQIIEACQDHGIGLPIGVDGSTPTVTQYQTIMVRGRPTVDLFGFASRVGSKRKRLYDVHEQLFKDGLVPKRRYHMVNRNLIYELPWEEVTAHCLCDITCAMDIGVHSLPFHLYLSQSTGIPIDQTGIVSINKNIESTLMRFANKRNEIIPNAGSWIDEQMGRLQGAQTFKPIEWFAEKVVVLDFSSQYPWIIVRNNIDYATFRESAVGGLGKYHMVADTDNDVNYFFDKEPIGLFAETTRYIIDQINEAKERFSGTYSAKYAGEVQALKTIGRSLYGYMKYKYARYPGINGARAVTAGARNEVRGSAGYVDDYYEGRLETIYGDTDSIFVRCIDEDCFNKEFMGQLGEEISKSVGAELAVDAFYDRIFFCELTSGEGLAKKKYIYIQDGKVGMAGFGGKRGDWSPIASKVQWKIAEKLMKTPDVEKGVLDSIRYTNLVLRNLTGVRVEDLAFTINVRGDPDTWDNILPHRAVALRDPSFIEEDGRVRYVIGTEEAGKRLHGNRFRNILSHRALHPSEIKHKDEIDFGWYRRKQVGTLALRVLEQFMWEYGIEEEIDTDISDVEYYKV